MLKTCECPRLFFLLKGDYDVMIGIDISDRSIKVAQVEGSPGKMVLRSVCWAPLMESYIRRGVIQNVPAVADALRSSFQKCSVGPVSADSPVVASIPETQSFVRVLDLPIMKDREVSEAVNWAVREHIPFDLERVYIDWQPLPEGLRSGGRRQVLVGAVQREVVDPLLEVLDAVGLRVTALELEAQAVVRALLPLDAESVQGVLVLDLGATSTNIVFFDRGIMRFTSSVPMGGDDLTKRLETGLHLQPELAAEKKAIVGLQPAQTDEDQLVANALREATIELLEQIKQVVRELATQQPEDNFVRAILLSGGSANLPGIRNVVAEVFPQVPVQMGNPWTNILFNGKSGQAPLSPQDASHFVTAVGLALRSEVEW